MKATTALRKISALKKRIWIIQGGQGAGKTIAILIILINHASSFANKEIIIASDELTKMRLTVIKDFKKIMKSFNLYEYSRFLGDTLYKFPNGSFIKFIGLDKEDIGKGLRSDILFINEANKTTFEKYREIASRAKRIIVDYNPNSFFWVDEHLKSREDAETLVLTFKDNESLSEQERREILGYKERGFINPDIENYDREDNIKSSYWANKWRVYGLGLQGVIDGIIFRDYKIIDNFPAFVKRQGLGIDFGYTTDPTAIILCGHVGYDLYLHEITYQTKMKTADIINTLKQYKLKVFADKAEPRLIDEIRDARINITGVEKPPGSVKAGIKIIREMNIYVTSTSLNLIDEFNNYTYLEKDGKFTDEPIDAFNHLIDAARYWAYDNLRLNKKPSKRKFTM